MAIEPGKIQPGRHDFTLQRRADYSMSLQFKDDSGVAVNLT